MTARLTVCGLGPGDPRLVTAATLDAVAACDVRFLRTRRHPTADVVGDARSFDDVYDGAHTFDEVYGEIVERLVAAAVAAGGERRVLYAVPGSPLVLESTVRRLRHDDRVDVEVVPALSFLDLAWDRLGVDPVDDGVRLVDGHRFAVEAAGERGPLLVAHTHAAWVLSDVKLAIDAGPEQRVVVLQGLGTPQERVFEVAWPDLDREVEPDHLTSLYLPTVVAPVASELMASVELMHRLRQDCPWDRAQGHTSLKPHLVEETYEVLEAIESVERAVARGDDPAKAYADLEEELGDLWFQILFHAELATENGQFTVADVARTLHDKLVVRHPHVFGTAVAADPAEVERRWEAIKRAEKARDSALDGIPAALPALLLAAKYIQRARRTGVPADPGPLGADLDRLLPGGDGDAVGRLLLAVVELACRHGVDAEDALRRAALAAADRFRAGERAGGPGSDWLLGQ